MYFFFSLWGLLAGILSAISKDFQNFIYTLVNGVFWISGVFYHIESVEIEWLKILLMLNPIAILITWYRNIFIDKAWIINEMTYVYIFIVELIFLTIFALVAYKNLRKDIPDLL